MDKKFLLTFTKEEKDGFRHSRHAWFASEEEMKNFVKEEKGIEVDEALELLEYREILM